MSLITKRKWAVVNKKGEYLRSSETLWEKGVWTKKLSEAATYSHHYHAHKKRRLFAEEGATAIAAIPAAETVIHPASRVATAGSKPGTC